MSDSDIPSEYPQSFVSNVRRESFRTLKSELEDTIKTLKDAMKEPLSLNLENIIESTKQNWKILLKKAEVDGGIYDDETMKQIKAALTEGVEAAQKLKVKADEYEKEKARLVEKSNIHEDLVIKSSSDEHKASGSLETQIRQVLNMFERPEHKSFNPVLNTFDGLKR